MMPVNATEMLPGWRRAYEAIWSLLPMTREHITQARSCITPAAVLHYAELSGVAAQRGVIPRWEEHDCGPGVYTKIELYDRVFAGIPTFGGELILITDECFPITGREPFFGRGESLREFLAEAPFVFDGDAVFIWPEARRISVFHHEGTFAHIDCHDRVA
jgi:hypothetical protein